MAGIGEFTGKDISLARLIGVARSAEGVTFTMKTYINDMTNEAVDAAIAERLGWSWRDDYHVEHIPHFTTDPKLTGFMLYGDSERGVPGLWGRLEMCSIKDGPTLWVTVQAYKWASVFGQGDTDEQRMTSAMARAFLVLLWERSEGC